MKGLMTLRGHSSSRNLEKKKKRDGINLQSDSILDQSPVLSSPPASPQAETSPRPLPSPGLPRSAPPSPSPHSRSLSPIPPSSPSLSSPLSSSPSSTSSSLTSSPSLTSASSSTRAASPPRSNRATRLIGKLAVEEPDEVGRFQIDADTEVKTNDDQTQLLKSHLKKLAAAVRRLNTDALRYTKTNTTFAQDGMDKLQIAEKRFNTESVYAEALTKFAEAERNVAANITQFHQAPADQLIARLTEFVEKDIAVELKSIKHRYEKARREYDSAVDKVTALRGKSKPDIIKLYNAERELKRLKKIYEDALTEVREKFEDIELKKSCNLIEWLILFFQQQRDAYGECFVVVQHLEGYLDELGSWIEEMKAFFHDSFQRRAEEQALIVQEERDAVHEPLLHLLETQAGVVGILQRIISTEGRSVFIPSRGDVAGITNLHGFLREFYDIVCQELILAGYRDQMKELASALGLLEKAKEEIEL